MDLEQEREAYESKKSRNDILGSICWLLLSATIFMELGWVLGGLAVGGIIVFRGWNKELKESYELSLAEESIKRNSENNKEEI